MKDRVLITGASGFVGSFMVDEALKRKYEVWAGIRRSSSLLYLQDERINSIEFDYDSTDRLRLQLKDFRNTHGEINFVIHCAGITKSANKTDFEKVNCTYTQNLLDALKQSGHAVKKFLFISSLGVMGKGEEDICSLFDASDLENPNTAYGKSKLNAERYLERSAYYPYIILRPTAVYGPRDQDFLMLAKTIRRGLAPTIGFKVQYPTFIYVEDLTNIAFDALESDMSRKKYLITDGADITDKEYVNLLKKVCGKESAVNVVVPAFLLKIVALVGDFVARLTGRSWLINSDKYKILTQRNWRCNILPIVEDLNFSPRYTLKEGLEKAIAWYEENGWLSK